MRWVVLLAVLAVSVLAVPDGFTTWFDSADCPDGWYPLVTAQGRLIVSVADPSQSGITVGKPLADQEDRVHSHGYSSSLNLPQKDVAAIGCCNNQGACHGNYPAKGELNDSPSNLPFTQLQLCTIKQGDLNPVPLGTIAHFAPSTSKCPANWMPFGESAGRFLVPGYATQGVIPSQALPLKSGEDRQHNHFYTTAVTTTEVSYEGVDGCCNSGPAASGVYNITGNSTSDSSQLPYIQLLTCVSQEQTFASKLPPQTLLYNEVFCAPGWNVSFSHSGRFLVALPNGGVPGATFGGASLRPGFSGDVTNHHTFGGTINTNSCGVGLASGCCGSGYVGNQPYPYQGVTYDTGLNLPYLSAPMCVQI